MAVFYPPVDFDEQGPCEKAGDHAERRVLTALDELDDRWRVFHGLQWRTIQRGEGERCGEADLILFHPNYRILVIEVKGGGVKVEHGEWHYSSLYDGSLHRMKMSPFEQARRTRFYIHDKLSNIPILQEILEETTLTHTAWFPDIPTVFATTYCRDWWYQIASGKSAPTYAITAVAPTTWKARR